MPESGPATGSESGLDPEAGLDPDLDDRTIIFSRAPKVLPWLLTGELGDSHEFTGKALLGRRPSAHPEHPGAIPLPLLDPSKVLSRVHALLEVTEDGAWITDLDSTNGTFLVVDGAPRQITPEERSEIHSGTKLDLGGLIYALERPATEPHPAEQPDSASHAPESEPAESHSPEPQPPAHGTNFFPPTLQQRNGTAE